MAYSSNSFLHAGGFPVKLNPSVALKRYGMQNLALLSWRISTCRHVKELDWTQPTVGELSDCNSGSIKKTLPLDESLVIAGSVQSSVSWQELSRSGLCSLSHERGKTSGRCDETSTKNAEFTFYFECCQPVFSSSCSCQNWRARFYSSPPAPCHFVSFALVPLLIYLFS